MWKGNWFDYLYQITFDYVNLASVLFAPKPSNCLIPIFFSLTCFWPLEKLESKFECAPQSPRSGIQEGLENTLGFISLEGRSLEACDVFMIYGFICTYIQVEQKIEGILTLQQT